MRRPGCSRELEFQHWGSRTAPGSGLRVAVWVGGWLYSRFWGPQGPGETPEPSACPRGQGPNLSLPACPPSKPPTSLALNLRTHPSRCYSGGNCSGPQSCSSTSSSQQRQSHPSRCWRQAAPFFLAHSIASLLASPVAFALKILSWI